MNIDFTEKELQVIQLIVPSLTPEETCNKVLRDWFNANLTQLPQQAKTQEQILDDVLTAHSAKIAAISSEAAV